MYQVPLVSADLTPAETVLQIADALDSLESIMTAVFDRVERRVQENGDRIRQIGGRMEAAAKKVEVLKQSKKSTAVFSSARYPAQSYRAYDALFPSFGAEETAPTPLKRRHLPAEKIRLDANSVREKMRFYHVPPKSRRPPRKDERTVPPSSISSASSFVIYNTADNPYIGSSNVNPLDNNRNKSKNVKGREDNAANQGLEAAPASLRNREEERDAAQDYFYSPDLGDLPELDLPDILDLPNIAQDLYYINDLGPGIAPSSVLSGGGSKNGSVAELNVPSVPPAAPPPPPPPPSPPPVQLPPPPPPPPMTTTTAILAAPPLVSMPMTTIVPPPPPPIAAPPRLLMIPPCPPAPPLAPPPPPPPSSVFPKDLPPDGEEVPDGGGGRANLMDSIRSAGLKGLKSVKERKRKEKLAKQEESHQPVSGGGDLMSDLTSKLQLRRKGIAGIKANATSSSSSVGVMDKISSMIPSPPPPTTTAAGKAESDDDIDDWDD